MEVPYDALPNAVGEAFLLLEWGRYGYKFD